LRFVQDSPARLIRARPHLIFWGPGNRLWRYTGARNKCSGPGCDAGASTITRVLSAGANRIDGHGKGALGARHDTAVIGSNSYVPTTTLHMRLSRP